VTGTGSLSSSGGRGPLEHHARLGVPREDLFVSIVRVGLAETKNFAEGYDAIFGKKKGGTARKAKPVAKKSTAKKKTRKK
jgi:hypothetical protein